MTVLITGVSCVGKTAVGESLATALGVPFVDLDKSVERELGAPIPRLQQRYRTMDLYREAAAEVLAGVLCAFDGRDAVIALPPSGLMGPYWRRLKGKSVFTVALEDTAENILERIRFYDDDSQSVERGLNSKERTHYLREIRKDMEYFGRSYRKANARVSISGCSVVDAADRIREALKQAATATDSENTESEQEGPGYGSQSCRTCHSASAREGPRKGKAE